MRRFKYVLDYLLATVKEGAVYTARAYADELGQLYDIQSKTLEDQRKTIASQEEKTREHIKHNSEWRKANEEQALQLGKLKEELYGARKHADYQKLCTEQLRIALRYSQEEHIKTREALETMREQRIKEKAQKIGEWYGAGGSFGDVVQKGKSIVFGGMDPAWQECPPDPRYSTPNTKTPDHAWRANPDKKWETSYTKRVVDELAKRYETWGGNKPPKAARDAIELLTDYHSTMHEVYEERDAALKTSTDTALAVVALNEQLDWKKLEWETVLDTNADLRTRIDVLIHERDFAKSQHGAALFSNDQLSTRISDLVKERDAASATVKARIREAVGL